VRRWPAASSATGVATWLTGVGGVMHACSTTSTVTSRSPDSNARAPCGSATSASRRRDRCRGFPRPDAAAAAHSQLATPASHASSHPAATQWAGRRSSKRLAGKTGSARCSDTALSSRVTSCRAALVPTRCGASIWHPARSPNCSRSGRRSLGADISQELDLPATGISTVTADPQRARDAEGTGRSRYITPAG
jgi:hypothetical protein